MFDDKNILPIMISVLFGTTPCSMFWLEGELEVELDPEAVDLIKQNPATQHLNWSPSAVMISDHEFLQELLPQLS